MSDPTAQSSSKTPSAHEHLSPSDMETIRNSSVGNSGINSGFTPDSAIDHEAHVSANGTSMGDTTKTAAKPKVDAKDAYQQEKPTLMGLRLGVDKDTVISRFGNTKDQFVMDEDTDAVTVYEYADFSVGFNTQNELLFVDVHTADIDPGLGGLRLGQKTEDALSILGKPDLNTTYVLSYKAQGTLLKLDMDPATNTIQSIKLFAN
jgi:hypothetical protein